jgi:hypothetical protein
VLTVKRGVLWYLSIVLIGVILVGSLGPYDFRSLFLVRLDTSSRIPALSRLILHRTAHFSAFGLLALFLSVSLRRPGYRLFALGFVIMLGIVIEVAEFLLSTNPFEFWDVRDDAVAASTGYVLAEALLFTVSAARRR